jgi:tRNA(Ile)-lysidine synthase
MPRTNLVETLLSACRADPAVAAGGPVLVAVSGGPDSTALLHSMWRAAPALELQLTAAHLDHGVRRRSEKDAAAVAATCTRLDIPLLSARAGDRVGRSEDALRRARHRFLEEAAAGVGAHTIALGHTADDQAETALLHILRGSGLEGLSAMAVREGLRFRPLLGVWRADVEAYCRRHRLAPVTDPSNRDRRYTRNRVRHELLPQLAEYNPRISQALVRLADSARDEHAVVVALAQDWLARQGRQRSRRSLAREPLAVQVEVVRRTWSAVGDGDEVPGDGARLRQAARLIVSPARIRGMLDLGQGLQLSVSGDRFHIVRKPPPKA